VSRCDVVCDGCEQVGRDLVGMGVRGCVKSEGLKVGVMV
jgi:hypothetical protein